MELKVKIKPRSVQAFCREAAVRTMTRGHVLTIDHYGNYYAPINDSKSNTVRVYNLQKVNRKAVGTKGPNREIVRSSHWNGYFYDIPVEVLRVCGLRVKQGLRNFKLEAARGSKHVTGRIQ